MRDIKKYTEDYAEEPCEKYQVRYRRKKILELMRGYKHENVLEIGCGMEPIFEYITDSKTIHVVEPSEVFYNIAVNKAGGKSGVTCIRGFFEDVADELLERKDYFDYIICSSLLHEVENPKRLLDAIYKVCDENTVVHINVPNAKSIHKILAENMGLISDIHTLSELQIKMQRKRVYDVESLVEAVNLAGFSVVDFGSYFPKFLSASQMERMLKCEIIDESIFEGLDKLITIIPEYGSEIYVQIRKA